MSRRLLCVVIVGWTLAAWSAAVAEQRFPPPDFVESGHQVPTTQTPPPENQWVALLDVAVLVVALSLASYLVLKRRSRRGVVVLGVFSLIYFGFWREGCVCSIGALQNVSLALFDRGYALPLVVGAFFLLPLLFTLFFGRTFCAAVCPLGAVQDVVAIKPVQVPLWLEHSLSLLRYVYLAAAVLFAATGSAFVICQYDPFVAFFRLSGSLNMLIFGAILLLLGMFVVRPYCRYLCPYGVLLGWLSWAARWHARIDPQQCIHCHLCQDACPVSAIDTPDAAHFRGDHGDGAPGSVRSGGDKSTVGRRRLGLMLLLVLPLILLGGWLGSQLAPSMSRMHVDVQLSERIRAEEAGAVEGVIDESEAFRATGRPIGELYELALRVRSRFAVAGPLAGLFLGIVFAVKLVQLARRRRQKDYDIDRTRCVACARCFKFCPHDPSNTALLESLSPAPEGSSP